MPKTASGRIVVQLLVKQYGFNIVSQKGSHMKLKKRTLQGEIITIVPMHKELARGTVRGIVRLAQIDHKEFLQYLIRKKK